MDSKGGGDKQVQLSVRLDDETMAALHQEGELMGDCDIEQTVQRRLAEGLLMAIVMGAKELVWRPIHRDSGTLVVSVPAAVRDELDHCAETWGYDRDVVVATVLSNSICKPMAVVAREGRSYAVSPVMGASQIRREPGRGNIYPVQFFLPGYQLVFVRMLAGAFFDKAAIIEEALLALAKQVVRGDPVRGMPAAEDAQAFARRMVTLAGPRFTSAGEAAW
ncbi:hypothetical protein [Caulobacter sp. Root1472]|uniref:hypothetical protein n=1 Tax=Caulobacter sp. Root1472 TaxID=1736470 RepID=UPI0012E39114|nr:hypothetical protein [Caulobacter sp. Root1472]